MTNAKRNTRRGWFRAATFAGLFTLGLTTGCFTGPDCINETRNLTLEGTSADGIRFFVAMDEARNHDSKEIVERRMTWAVFGAIGTDAITAIHLHQGPAGPILANLPATGARLGVLADGDAFDPGFLTSTYDQVFDLLTTQPIYADFHTGQVPGGRSEVLLPVQFNNPWVHAYCS